MLTLNGKINYKDEDGMTILESNLVEQNEELRTKMKIILNFKGATCNLDFFLTNVDKMTLF